MAISDEKRKERFVWTVENCLNWLKKNAIYLSVPFLLLLFLIFAVFQHDRVQVNTMDRDGDGQVDEWQYFQRTKIVKKEFDSNNDGKKDTTLHYLKGVCARIEYDTNYDGETDIWETRMDEMILGAEASLDFDGRVNFLAFYDEGKLIREETDVNFDGRPDMWLYYENDKPLKREIDRDYDGVVDEVEDIKEEKPKEEVKEDLVLKINFQKNDFEEGSPIEFELILKNISLKTALLARPHIDLKHRAARVFIKKDEPEFKYKEYAFGARTYAPQKEVNLNPNDDISGSWRIDFKNTPSLYEGYGAYVIYAEYRYDDDGAKRKGYWFGRVKSQEARFIIKKRKTDLWIEKFLVSKSFDVSPALMDTYNALTENEKKEIIGKLQRIEEDKAFQFVLFQKVVNDDKSVVPLLINNLERENTRLRLKSLEALRKLTGNMDNYGIDWERDFKNVRQPGIEFWRQWWDENKSRFETEEEISPDSTKLIKAEVPIS